MVATDPATEVIHFGLKFFLVYIVRTGKAKFTMIHITVMSCIECSYVTCRALMKTTKPMKVFTTLIYDQREKKYN